MRRRWLIGITAVAAGIALVAAAPYALRLLPLLQAADDEAERVVLLHGLGRSGFSMILVEAGLADAGFEVHNLGYPSTARSPEALVESVGARIEACCIEPGRTVHFVGHSLGGLLIRAWLAENRPPDLGRVVLIGAPNGGSELVDAEARDGPLGPLLERAGPAAAALTTGPDGFPAHLPPPYYPVGVIAGTEDNPVGNAYLPQPNDGMVSVASARLTGMSDFVTFDLAHWTLRRDPRVAEQVVAFLRTGSFTRPPAETALPGPSPSAAP